MSNVQHYSRLLPAFGPCSRISRVDGERLLTLFGHGHVGELFLQLDDEHAEAVRAAAIEHK